MTVDIILTHHCMEDGPLKHSNLVVLLLLLLLRQARHIHAYLIITHNINRINTSN